MTKTERILYKIRGFTRIELLVVTLIITITAGMFIPALATTREEADQETCLANLKQIGRAYLMYLQDYDGWFPPLPSDAIGGPCAWGLYSDGREATLPRFLKKYIPGDVSNVSAWPEKDGMSEIWRCPSLETPGLFYDVHPYWYYANPFLTSTPGAYPVESPGLWNMGCYAVPKLSAVNRSYEKVHVVADYIPNIHNAMTSAVFLDGHAETVKGEFSWYKTEYGAPSY